MRPTQDSVEQFWVYEVVKIINKNCFMEHNLKETLRKKQTTEQTTKPSSTFLWWRLINSSGDYVVVRLLTCNENKYRNRVKGPICGIYYAENSFN